MRKMGLRWLTPMLGTMLLYGIGSSSVAQTIANGGFEANGGAGFPNFMDWVTADQFGSAGSFYVQTGNGTPLFGNLTPAPPEGMFAAMTDAGGAGSHVLYQDFAVPANVMPNTTLSFQVFAANLANDFVTPTSLDYTGMDNQQARVDLLLSSADPFSTASGDVLLNLYQTRSSDPLVSGYTFVSTDVTSVLQAHTGQTLRLRFAEVDNINILNFGVDNVRFNGANVPEPSAVASLFAGCLAGGMIGLRSRRRARR